MSKLSILTMVAFSVFMIATPLPIAQANEFVRTSDGTLIPSISLDESHSEQNGEAPQKEMVEAGPLSAVQVEPLTVEELKQVVNQIQELADQIEANRNPSLQSGKPVVNEEVQKNGEFLRGLEESYGRVSSSSNREVLSGVEGRGLVETKSSPENEQPASKTEGPFNYFLSLLQRVADETVRFVESKYSDTKERVRNESLDQEIKALRDLKLELSGNLINLGPQNYADGGTMNPGDEYHVVDSVMIGKWFASVHDLLNPPKNLHPYLRLLFYWRLMNPDMVRAYLSARQKIEDLYEKAKEGNGNIRYRGKIYDAYLPLPDEGGGSYELVALIMKDKKSRALSDTFVHP